MKSEIIKLGVVGVDTGQLMICDPCYIEGEFLQANTDIDTPAPTGEFSYRGIFQLTCEKNKFGGQLNYSLGHPGVAVAFQSGFGDGTYEVFAEIVEIKGWGKRVKKVWVELITEEEIAEEEIEEI